MVQEQLGHADIVRLDRVTRHIRPSVERELWARAAGRCEFSGCNRILYKSPVTQEAVNISQKAHIYSFSPEGPRGRGPLKKNVPLLNDVFNLMLICHDCHRKVDQRKDGGRYPASLLLQWKLQHEKRVALVTGVDPRKKSTVVLYGANIGDEKSQIQPQQANWALFPHWYPAEETPLRLSMSWEGKDDHPDYWKIEEKNLLSGFDRIIRSRIEEGEHFSVFGFAPMPLLIRLGTLFTDKIPAQVYQLHREPEQTWRWSDERDELNNTDYTIKSPSGAKRPPALIISLSASIDRQRVTSVLGEHASIWELALNNPHNDFLRTRTQLSKFRQAARLVMVQIAQKHGINTPVAVFPSMPVSTAVELGRVRMPKADMPWTVYDYNNKAGAFVKALTISGGPND